MTTHIAFDYHYPNAEAGHTKDYLWPSVTKILKSEGCERVFDLGCGNGAFARELKNLGVDVCGVDPSEQGIAQALAADSMIKLEIGDGYQPLSERFGKFPGVISLEVIGHVYYPRKFAKCIADLLEPGGIAIVSTPYHSYCKNLILALSGRLEQHFGPLWDHGMIKFWSVDTLTQLFEEVGLKRTQVLRVGRLPVIAMSMILVFQKPQ